jgi:hypothetical protein
MIMSLSRYHNINYTVVGIKYNRYIKNNLTISRVKTGDFPFIIKDLQQLTS